MLERMDSRSSLCARPLLEAADVVMMSVLGILHEGPASILEVVDEVRNLVSPEWRPTSDVICSGIARSVGTGYVLVSGGGDGRFVSITELGRDAFHELLAIPTPESCGGLGRTCVVLKTYFVEHADAETKRRIVADLSGFYRRQLCELLESCGRCPRGRRLMSSWAERETRRIEQELEWLAGFESLPGTENAGRSLGCHSPRSI